MMGLETGSMLLRGGAPERRGQYREPQRLGLDARHTVETLGKERGR